MCRQLKGGGMEIIMKKIVLAGLINIETTVAVGAFPIEYSPIDYRFFGVESTVSGVGYNLSKAMKTLGTDVEILSLAGKDMFKPIIDNEFKKEGISTEHVIEELDNIPQSVILYDSEGKRKINLDLKDIQDKAYPTEKVSHVIADADVVIPCNINFARSVMREAKKLGKLIATDVHVIDNTEDEYNKEFMEAADILFFSNENIFGREEKFVKEVIEKYDNEIIVVGLGKEGALLYVKADDTIVKYPAVDIRKVVSTIGAGDALFSAFIHFYINGATPYDAIQNAIVFASYKIGEKGGAKGFLSESELLELKAKL